MTTKTENEWSYRRLTLVRVKQVVKYDAEYARFDRVDPSCPRLIGQRAEIGKTGSPYRYVKIDHMDYRTDALAWFYCFGVWPDGFLEPIDGDLRNINISNLKVVPYNPVTTKPKNYPGVTCHEGVWQVWVHGVHTGSYSKLGEACWHYDREVGRKVAQPLWVT